MGRKLGWAVSVIVLLVSSAQGAYNGVQGLEGARTALQYSVTVGGVLYGVVGLAAGVALAMRRPASIWLAVLWGVLVTYVASTAALAYAGAHATVAGAVAGGIGAALIAALVVWSARVGTPRTPAGDARRAMMVLVALASAHGVGACRQLYGGPPAVGNTRGLDRTVTKRVRAKVEPDRLIAEDLSICFVIPDVFAGIRPGDHWRCEWR